MNVEPGDDDLTWAELLAAHDDALASGPDVDDTLEDAIPAELRDRFHRDVGWCRLVRQALTRIDPGSESPTWTAFDDVPTSRPASHLGRFELKRELGRGAYGVVFLAYDPRLCREVALKVPKAVSFLTSELRERFRQESRAAASLDHPNIVPVYDAGEVGPISFIASAYISGETLAAWLHRRGDEPVPYRTAAKLVSALANAVAHAHGRGVLHRDLKPGNILLETLAAGDSSGPRDSLGFTPKITDFGLAKVLAGADDAGPADFPTMTGAILGTPNYMAPEQAEGRTKDVGRPSDVHALGAILYELITGRPPFRTDSPLETLEAIRSREPVAPSRLRPGVPRDVETICLKCLEKDPRHRYPDAAALADDLRRYLQGEPIAARPVGPAQRFALRCQRNPVVAATVLVAVAAIVLVAGISVWRVVSERDRFHAERDRSEANLYRALLGEARAKILARDTGWYWDVLDNLRDASRLGNDRDPAEPRELAVRCLGSDCSCFRPLGSVEAHPGGVRVLALSSDANLVASGGSDGVVRVWTPDTRTLVATLSGHEGLVSGLAFLADGRRLMSSGRDGTLRVWALEGDLKAAHSQSISLEAGPIFDLQASPDGTSVAAACQDGTIRLLDLRDSSRSPDSKILRGHNGPVRCLAFSPSGHWLASGSDDLSVRTWHLSSGRLASTWLVGSAPACLAYTSDGGAITWGDRETFSLYTRRTVFPFRQTTASELHGGPVTKLAYDAKGRMFTASTDGTVKLWWFAERPRSGVLAVAGSDLGSGKVLTLAVTPDGRGVISGHDDGCVRFWELGESPRRTFINHGSQSAAFTRGRVLAIPQALIDLTHGLDAPARTPIGPDEIKALIVRPGKRSFAIGREDGALEVWDLDARRCDVRWSGHAGRVMALAGSPDGRLLASASTEGPVKVWEWDTGKLARELGNGSADWHALAWSADGAELVAAGEGGVLAWDLKADASSTPRRIVDRLLLGQAIAIREDTLAIVGDNGTVEIRDLHSGALRHTLPGRGGDVTALAFSPQGQTLAVARNTSTVRLWDAGTGAELATLEHAPNADSLDFSPDGCRLTATVGGIVVLWDVAAGKPIAREVETPVQMARFLSDGSALVQAVGGGSVNICPIDKFERAHFEARATSSGIAVEGFPVVRASETIAPGRHTSTVWGIAASPDGKWLATASHDGAVVIWDAATGRRSVTLRGHNSIAWAVAFSADSRLVASSGDGIKVWDVATGRERASFDGHQRLVSTVGFHPTQPWLISGGYDGTVRVWDWKSGQALGVLHQTPGTVNGVAIRPDGRWVVAACSDGRARAWDLSRPLSFPSVPDRVLEGKVGALWSVNFSADGQALAAGSELGAIALWNGASFERLTTLRGGSGQVRGVTFSRDGGLLAGSAYNAAMVVWDLVGVRDSLREMSLDWRP